MTSLDVSGFDMSNVTDISYMFDHCSKLKTIYCKDSKTNWSRINGENVFFGCDELIGADGDAQIAFNFNSVDSSKAKSASLRGYFSTKGSVPKIFIQNGSIIFLVGLAMPHYRLLIPSASLDMNLRQCFRVITPTATNSGTACFLTPRRTQAS